MAEKGTLKSPLAVVDDHIILAEELIARATKINHVEGIGKLQRKCLAELKFLKKLKNKKDLNENHVKSSNLTNLNGILTAAESLPQVTQVLKLYHYRSKLSSDQMNDESTSILVDVVCQNMFCWVKIIARKAEGLHYAWAGDNQFGQRSIFDQAKEYASCAGQNQVKYMTPKVACLFLNGVTAPVAEEIERYGILVYGERVPVNAKMMERVQALQGYESNSDSDLDSDCDSTEEDTVQVSEAPVIENGASSSDFKKNDLKGTLSDQEQKESECATVSGNKNEDKSAETEEGRISFKGASAHSITSNPDNVFCGKKGSNLSVIDIGASQDLPSIQTSVHLASHSVSSETNLANPMKLESQDSSSPGAITHAMFDEDVFCQGMRLVLLRMHSFIHSGDSEVESGVNSGFKSQSSQICKVDIKPSVLLSVQPTTPVINKVNLDITALIGLVSNLTHGSCNLNFAQKILNEQAELERRHPLMPVLLDFIKGKDLYSCETAVKDFQSILGVVGGPAERERGDELLKRIKIIPDGISDKAKVLTCTGHVKERAKVIFGTGDNIQAVTVTANKNFINAAKDQGVVFVVFTISPRALTEQKESMATPISV